MAKSKYGKEVNVVWKDRKRFMGMPLSFTRYILAEKNNSWVKLFVSVGFFSTKEEEVNAYRILDITLNRTFSNKIFGVRTLKLTCKDATDSMLVLKRIKKPYEIRDLIAETVEKERAKKRIRVNEFQTTDTDADDLI